MTILVCFGTRPEWLKVKPVVEALQEVGVPVKTLKVKQHTTLISDVPSDYEVTIPSYDTNRLDLVLSSIGYVPQEAFTTVTHTLVQGDTATALLCAIASFHRNIPVIHLEAGLRTYDIQNPYPEEAYRQMISRVTSIHLCPTEGNRTNLNKEGVNGKIFVVGNTALDNLNKIKATVSERGVVLITLHRRENHQIMKEWFTEIKKLATIHHGLKFVFPMHPNPNVQRYKDVLGDRVKVIEPLSHEEFLKELACSRVVISDSGGIQEECSFLGKKVLVCRTTTERPESLGKTSWLVRAPSDLVSKFDAVCNLVVKPSFVYGNGQSGKTVAAVIQQELKGDSE